MDLGLQLAFNLNSNPKTMALLLGSGISRSAGIPTGWDVMIDLICKLAALRGEARPSDPITWFSEVFGHLPSYDELLQKLGPKPSDRNAIMRPYFEATDAEREAEIKIPTPAHRAIARLVKSGTIRIILTTNFDRLLEDALRDEGIVPNVLSSEENLAGNRPYIHAPCTVVKLHGDYIDERFLNTTLELEKYPEAWAKLLDRILDEHGLIICGWSGEWDVALRSILRAAPSRRYMTYWLGVGKPGEQAVRLIEDRQASYIAIESADTFFTALAERVESIQVNNTPHPSDVRTIVAVTKKLMSKPELRIPLEELMREQAVSSHSVFSSYPLDKEMFKDYWSGYQALLSRYRSAAIPFLSVASTICWYSSDTGTDALVRALNLWGTTKFYPGNAYVSKAQLYPAMLLLYTCGIACVASKRFSRLAALIDDPIVVDVKSGNRMHVSRLCEITHVTSEDKGLTSPDPVGDALDYLWTFFSGILTRTEFDTAFNAFQFLLLTVMVEREWTDKYEAPFKLRTFLVDRGTRESIYELLALLRKDDNLFLRDLRLFGERGERFNQATSKLRTMLESHFQEPDAKRLAYYLT